MNHAYISEYNPKEIYKTGRFDLLKNNSEELFLVAKSGNI